MTILAADNTRAICRIQLKREGRWVSLALSIGDLGSGNRFLVPAERLVYEMVGVDDLARRYGLANWKGGVISGARYAFRVLKSPNLLVCLHELRGQLGSGDVSAVSCAAALAIGRLLHRAEVPLDLGGWTLAEETRSPPIAEEIEQIVSSHPESLQTQTENGPTASGAASIHKASQVIRAEPGATADGARDTGL